MQTPPSRAVGFGFVDKSVPYGSFTTVEMVFTAHHCDAGIAQLVERCLAKAKVAGSNPVSRSILEDFLFNDVCAHTFVAGRVFLLIIAYPVWHVTVLFGAVDTGI